MPEFGVGTRVVYSGGAAVVVEPPSVSGGGYLLQWLRRDGSAGREVLALPKLVRALSRAPARTPSPPARAASPGTPAAQVKRSASPASPTGKRRACDSDSDDGIAASVRAKRARNMAYLSSLGLDQFRLKPAPQRKNAQQPAKPRRHQEHQFEPNTFIWDLVRSRADKPADSAAGPALAAASSPPRTRAVQRGDLQQADVDLAEHISRGRVVCTPCTDPIPSGRVLQLSALKRARMRGMYRIAPDRLVRLKSHPTEPLVVGGSVRGAVGMVNLETGATVSADVFDFGPARGVCFQQATTDVLACSDVGMLRRYSAEKGVWEELLYSDEERMECVVQPCTHKDSVWLCTTGGDVLQFDLRAKGIAARFAASTTRVYSVCPHPTNENVLMTNALSCDATIWDARTCMGSKKPVHTAQMQHARCVSSAAFSPTGNRVLTSSWDNTVCLWDVSKNSTEAVGTWSHHNETGRFLTKLNVSFLPSSECVALTGSRGRSTPKGSIDVHDFEARSSTNVASMSASNQLVNSLVDVHARRPFFTTSFSAGCVGVWF